MELSRQKSQHLLFECATTTVGAMSEEEVMTPSKLGMAFLSRGIDPFMLGYTNSKTEPYEENRKKAGKLLKEWGEILQKEDEPKKD